MKRGESGNEHSVHSNQPTSAAKSGFTLTPSVWADEALQQEAEHNKNHDKRYKNNNAVDAVATAATTKTRDSSSSKTPEITPNRKFLSNKQANKHSAPKPLGCF